MKIFQAEFFKKNQKIQLVIDNGEYVYNQHFKSNYKAISPKLLINYIPISDSIKIYFKVDEKVLETKLSSTVEKILFGIDVNQELFLKTERDETGWIQD